MAPLPGRTSVERCLIHHGLVTLQAHRRKRSDKRWEPSRAMERWQMDGGVRLLDDSVAKIVSSIDDHSRFVGYAEVAVRATVRPVGDDRRRPWLVTPPLRTSGTRRTSASTGPDGWSV